MPEWWTYRPEDFLLFSERVYWRLFELHNAALWPWPIAAPALGAVVAARLLLRPQGSAPLIAGVLAACWILVAWAFFWVQYATINWAAPYAAPVFVLQAALLVVVGGFGGALSPRAATSADARLGLALLGYALLLHPLVALLAGRPLLGAEVFGAAPDPTALATLGLAAMARPGAGRLWLVPIPLFWCVLSWATLQTMGAWEAWPLLGATLCAVAALLLSRERDPGRAQE